MRIYVNIDKKKFRQASKKIQTSDEVQDRKVNYRIIDKNMDKSYRLDQRLMSRCLYGHFYGTKMKEKGGD